jgi:hypothetical protein
VVERAVETAKAIAADVVTRGSGAVERGRKKRRMAVERRHSKENDRMNELLKSPLRQMGEAAEIVRRREMDEAGDGEDSEWEVYDFEDGSGDENE